MRIILQNEKNCYHLPEFHNRENRMDWKPCATYETLKMRVGILKEIRAFFEKRGYLEVETPIMAQYGGTDVYLQNIQAYFREKPYCLQTSPEYHMKRLLAAGYGPIFQMGHVFRDDEFGRWHNPEFSMLEWYQLNIDHHQLMDEMDMLLQHILKTAPSKRITHDAACRQYGGFSSLESDVKILQEVAADHHLGNVLGDESDKDAYVFLLMSHIIEPALAKYPYPIMIYDFPASQAALARIEKEVACRFEVYYRGVDLANGFYELCDAELQHQRFEQDRKRRQERGSTVPDMDPYFLAALDHGLPPCSGVALGIDRLIALALSKASIREVMAFDIVNA